MQNFRSLIMERTKALQTQIQQKLDIPTKHIIDVILFPGVQHLPIVRIDGSYYSRDVARTLECVSPYILVRIPSILPHFPAHFFSKNARRLHSPLQSPLSKRWRRTYQKIQSIVTQIAFNHKINIAGWVLWEIEIESNNIIIRFVRRRNIPRKTIRKRAAGIVFEFRGDMRLRDGLLLLQLFDRAKMRKQLFFESLNSVLQL